MDLGSLILNIFSDWITIGYACAIGCGGAGSVIGCWVNLEIRRR